MVATKQNSYSHVIPAPPPRLHVIKDPPAIRSTGDHASVGNMALLREAGDRLHAAQSLAGLRAAPLEFALSELVLAGLSLAMGDITRARDLLASARTNVESIEAELSLEHEVRLREQVASAPARPAPLAASLSARELEVLRLVAEGMTNAAIAEQLFISPRTVGGHIHSIFNKLGVSSRTAAAAYAYRHNLI